MVSVNWQTDILGLKERGLEGRGVLKKFSSLRKKESNNN
jgi:hypothetical protein